MVYLVLTSFYFRGVAFVGLLLLPFASAIMGNPAVNANIVAFGTRYLPFLALHYGILLLLGQRFLIPRGSQGGFWFRAGMLWVAMWWDHLCALLKALGTKRVTDRIVASKWKKPSTSPWRGLRAHLVLTSSAMLAFAWTFLSADRRQTVEGTLLFLGLIVVSQAIIIFKAARTARQQLSHLPRQIRQPQPLAMPVYSQPSRKL